MYIWRWWLGFGCWPCWIMFTYSKMEVIPKHLFDCCSVNSFTAGLSNSSDINILFYSASWSKLSLPWGKFNEYFIILFCNSWCDSVFKWYLLSLHFVLYIVVGENFLSYYVSRFLAMHYNLVLVLYIQGSKLATLPRPDSAVEVLLIGELLLL